MFLLGLLEDSELHHKEATAPGIKRDEADIKLVVELLQTWGPVFTQSENLTSLASGAVATEQVTTDLLKAEAKGEEAFTTFVKKRLFDKKEDFLQPLRQMKLSTFTTMLKSTGEQTLY